MRQPHHGRGGSHHIGRVRIELAKLLTKELGFQVEPTDLYPATGSWRTDVRLDVHAWEWMDGVHPSAGCWDSMTKFLKEAKKLGCHIEDGELYTGRSGR